MGSHPQLGIFSRMGCANFGEVSCWGYLLSWSLVSISIPIVFLQTECMQMKRFYKKAFSYAFSLAWEVDSVFTLKRRLIAGTSPSAAGSRLFVDKGKIVQMQRRNGLNIIHEDPWPSKANDVQTRHLLARDTRMGAEGALQRCMYPWLCPWRHSIPLSKAIWKFGAWVGGGPDTSCALSSLSLLPLACSFWGVIKLRLLAWPQTSPRAVSSPLVGPSVDENGDVVGGDQGDEEIDKSAVHGFWRLGIARVNRIMRGWTPRRRCQRPSLVPFS